MAEVITKEMRRSLQSHATLRKLRDQPELIPDLLDLREQLWKELPHNPYDDRYTKPWLLQTLDGPSGSLALDGGSWLGAAVALTGSSRATQHPWTIVGGGAISAVASGVKLMRDYQAASRHDLGRRLWVDQFDSVAAFVDAQWALDDALGQIAANPGTARVMRDSAREAQQRLREWRAANDLPDDSTSLRKLMLDVSPLEGKVEQAAANAAAEHDPQQQPDAFEKALVERLQKMADDQEQLKELMQQPAEQARQWLQAQQDAAAAAEAERAVQEFVGAGTLVGWVIGLKDQARGAATRQIAEQLGVVHRQWMSINAALDANRAISLASLATGVGALFAIAGALSAFGGGQPQGPSATEVILQAIDKVLEGLGKLGAQIEALSDDVRRLGERSALQFARVQGSLARLATQVSELEATLASIKQEDFERALFDAARDLQTAGSAEAALALLNQAYSTTLLDASRNSMTLEGWSATRLAAFVHGLADVGRVNPFMAAGEAPRLGGPMLLSTALERCPTLLARAAASLADTPARRAQHGDALRIDSGLLKALSREPLRERRAVLPAVTASAVQRAVEASGFLMLRPDLTDATANGALTAPEMLHDIVRVASWPLRVTQALADDEVLRDAERAVRRHAAALLAWVAQQRMARSRLLAQSAAAVRACILLGGVAVDQGDVLDPRNSTALRPQFGFELADEPSAAPTLEALSDVREIADAAELDRVQNALDALASAGELPQLHTVQAWVDEPWPGQPAWLGGGEFHEIYALRLPQANGSPGRVLLWLRVDDPGWEGGQEPNEPPYVSFVGQHLPSFGDEDGPDEDTLRRYHAARGRVADVWDSTVGAARLNGAPFDDRAHAKLDALVAAFGTNEGETLHSLAWDLRDRGAALTVWKGDVDNWSSWIDGRLFAAMQRDLQSSLAIEGVAALRLPTPLVEACAQAWLDLLTVRLARLDREPATLAAAQQLLQAMPALLRDAGDAAVATPFFAASVQQALWGAAALQPWRLHNPAASPPLRWILLDAVSFGALQARDKGDPEAPAGYVGWICEKTLAIRLAPPPGAAALGAVAAAAAPPLRVSCLPLTHRALASAQRLSLLARQVGGWQA